MNKLRFAAALTVLIAFSGTAPAAELKVLAAGGMRPGLNAAAEVFRQRTGTEVKFTYEPPVDLGKRVAGGEAGDIIVSSPGVVAELTKAGKSSPTLRCISGGSVSAWWHAKMHRSRMSLRRQPLRLHSLVPTLWCTTRLRAAPISTAC